MAHFLSFHPETTDPHCIACEALLTDALDGNLGEIDQAWFDRHVRICAACGSLYADAQRGAAWLDLLKSAPPEPPADLIGRILAQTGQPQNSQPVPAFATPAPAIVLPFEPRSARWAYLPAALFEPRLAMTAAMALFSLALTMNLTGIQLGQLRPTNLRRTYFQSAAGAARYYDNLRVVRVLESRVDDLREENSGSDEQSSPLPELRPAPTHSPTRTSAKNVQAGQRCEPARAIPDESVRPLQNALRSGWFLERRRPGMNPTTHDPQASSSGEARPVAFCQNCGRPLSRETVRVVGPAVYCEPCLAARLSGASAGPAYQPVPPGASTFAWTSSAGRQNPNLAALLGLIPGVGAMYNEQYAKGIAHLFIFAVLVSLSHISEVFGLLLSRLGLLHGH